MPARRAATPSGGDGRAAASDADVDEAAALARLYDLDLLDDPGDLDLYLALANRTGGPILELAVGSGRLAVPLAAAGYEVTGVDRDRSMLERAQGRARAAGRAVEHRLRLIEADLVGLALGGRSGGSAGARRTGPPYRLAIIALNSLMLLPDRAGQVAALRAMAEHLAPGGLAVVDVWLPDADDLARFDGRWILEYARRDPESGRWVTKSGSGLHDAATATLTLTSVYEEGTQGTPPIRWLRRDRLRLVNADELRSMALEAGLEVELLAGGYALDALRPGDERVVLVGACPPDRRRPGRRTKARPG